MPKAIVKGPGPEKKYQARLGYKGVNVINGAVPNGKLPKVIGSGIFGYQGQKDGMFGGNTIPPGQHTGIFYEDDARYDYEVAQPDIGWELLRRPGRPLYPGSSSRGIVLVGPSMGSDFTSPNSTVFAFGVAGLMGLMAWSLWKKHFRAEEY